MAFFPAQHRALAIGFGLILAAGAIVALIWAGTYLPGLAGEFFSMIAGIMWTPILLDITLFCLGIGLILWLNARARARDGDEYVYLEQVEGPDVPGEMPAEARSAVFPEKPEPQGIEPSLAAIEDALELGDHKEASALLFALPEEELDGANVIALRVRLARGQGHDLKAQELLEQLRLKSPHHPLIRAEDPGDR